jgi:hypothetical protein
MNSHLVIPLTFKLAFLLLCVLSRISSKKLMPMKVPYPQIHKQLKHIFLLMIMTMRVVSFQKMMKKETLR